MPNTRGNLEPATIENLSTQEKVYCMFNPHEYTLAKQNQWEAGETKGRNVPKVKFKQGGAETLKLQLFFDTYADGSDVRQHTDPLWKMMMVSSEKKNQRNNKSEPPHVAFHWGSFYFRAVVTNISQKFTLFSASGLPLRTAVDVSFQQVEDPEEHAKQNPTSGGSAPRKMYTVETADRLDLIAYKVYGEATQWRLIADENGLTNPHRLREGQQLVIPPLE